MSETTNTAANRDDHQHADAEQVDNETSAATWLAALVLNCLGTAILWGPGAGILAFGVILVVSLWVTDIVAAIKG